MQPPTNWSLFSDRPNISEYLTDEFVFKDSFNKNIHNASIRLLDEVSIVHKEKTHDFKIALSDKYIYCIYDDIKTERYVYLLPSIHELWVYQ